MTELFLSAWLLVSHGFEWPHYAPEQGDEHESRVDELADVPLVASPALGGLREYRIRVSATAHTNSHRRAARSLLPEVAKCHAAGLKRNPDDPATIGDLSMLIFVDAKGKPRVLTIDSPYDNQFGWCVRGVVERAHFPQSAATINYSVFLDEL